MIASVKRQIFRLSALMLALNILLPVGLYLYSIIFDQAYWRMYRGEYHLVEWFSSVQLLLVGWIAYINYMISGLAQRLYSTQISEYRWIWGWVAVAFLLFALDERFDFHEALRDDFFRPAGFFVGISWLIDGDIGLYLFFGIGLIASVFLFKDIQDCPVARFILVAALLLTFPTIVVDSMHDEVLRTWPYWRFWDYTFEEVGEIWAQLLFLSAFLLVLNKRVKKIGENVELPRQMNDASGV